MKFFYLIWLFFIAWDSFALSKLGSKKGDLHFGVLAGYQVNFLDHGPPGTYRYTDGSALRGGLNLEYFFEEWVAFDLAIIGESKQFEHRTAHDDIDGENISTAYVSVLPLYNFYFFDFPLNLKFGARIGIEVSSDIYDYEPFKYGIVSGFGYYFPIGNDYGIRPEILYDYGISELDEQRDLEVHSLIFQLTFYFKGY